MKYLQLYESFINNLNDDYITLDELLEHKHVIESIVLDAEDINFQIKETYKNDNGESKLGWFPNVINGYFLVIEDAYKLDEIYLKHLLAIIECTYDNVELFNYTDRITEVDEIRGDLYVNIFIGKLSQKDVLNFYHILYTEKNGKYYIERSLNMIYNMSTNPYTLYFVQNNQTMSWRVTTAYKGITDLSAIKKLLSKENLSKIKDGNYDNVLNKIVTRYFIDTALRYIREHYNIDNIHRDKNNEIVFDVEVEDYFFNSVKIGEISLYRTFKSNIEFEFDNPFFSYDRKLANHVFSEYIDELDSILESVDNKKNITAEDVKNVMSEIEALTIDNDEVDIIFYSGGLNRSGKINHFTTNQPCGINLRFKEKDIEIDSIINYYESLGYEIEYINRTHSMKDSHSSVYIELGYMKIKDIAEIYNLSGEYEIRNDMIIVEKRIDEFYQFLYKERYHMFHPIIPGVTKFIINDEKFNSFMHGIDNKYVNDIRELLSIHDKSTIIKNLNDIHFKYKLIEQLENDLGIRVREVGQNHLKDTVLEFEMNDKIYNKFNWKINSNDVNWMIGSFINSNMKMIKLEDIEYLNKEKINEIIGDYLEEYKSFYMTEA